MVNTIRLGYVGCGFMAQKVHIPNFANVDGCALVALAELRQDLGSAVQSHWRIPKLYPGHEEMLADPEIDAIAVSAPYAIQGNIARDALEAGKHVFMEKPMAVSVDQADRILAAAVSSGARLMVGYMKRYDAGNELVKSRLEKFNSSNELGTVTYARNHGFCGDWVAGLDTPMIQAHEPPPQSPVVGPDWLPPEHLDRYLGFLQQYTHNINLLRWFLDAGDDVSVRVVDLDDDGYTGIVVLDMAGTRAVLETGRVSHYRWDEHTQIYFRDGWIKTWAPPLLLRQVPAEVEVYRAGSTQCFERPIPVPAWSWSYRREAEHFIRCLQSGDSFRSSGADTRTDVRLFEEIYRAHLGHIGAL